MNFVLVQEPWTLETLGTILPAVADGDGARPLVLLAPSVSDAAAPTRETAVAALSGLAKAAALHIAGDIVVTVDDERRHLGFLFDDVGEALLLVGKSLPDVTQGFSDVAAMLGTARDFAVADTPYGKLAMVIGEDVLAPHLVRAHALAGAEIILNPALEHADRRSGAREVARAARAYENICYVLTAGPRVRAHDGVEEILPSITAIHDSLGHSEKAAASFFHVRLDLEALRQQRQVRFANFLAVHRTSLYGRGYARERAPLANRSPQRRADWREEGRRRVAKALPPGTGESRYDVALAQTLMRPIPDADHKDEVLELNLKDSLAIAGYYAPMPNVRLIVFPEFWLQGFVAGRATEEWLKIAIEIPGKETERLSDFARKNKIYVSGAAFEIDRDWPGRWFNTAFVIDDAGELIHKYRKIQCGDLAGLLSNTTPGNVLTRYLDKYGYDYLFPVARTPLGNIATIICFDVNFPETSRALVKRGAEIILHPTAEVQSSRRKGWEKARLTRAFENTAYFISAGMGGEFRHYTDQLPGYLHGGYSKIVSFDGTVPVATDGPGRVCVTGTVDLSALRRARQDATTNLVLWDDAGAYADFYMRHAGFPEDVWLDTPMQKGSEGIAAVNKVVERYTADGIFVAPTGGAGSQRRFER